MKVILAMLPLAFLVVSITADKRVRPFSFQRQTASSEKPPASDSGPYPPSGWKPEKPSTTTEASGPYPPSGWKPDGPQLEAGPPPKPEGSTPAPDSETGTPAPAKLVTFVRPQNTVVYYVLPDGKLQQLVIAPRNPTLLESASYRQVNTARPLQLQVIDSHTVDLEPQQESVFAYNGPLLRVLRKA